MKPVPGIYVRGFCQMCVIPGAIAVPLAIESRKGGIRVAFECRQCTNKWLEDMPWRRKIPKGTVTFTWYGAQQESFFEGPVVRPHWRISRGITPHVYARETRRQEVAEWVLREPEQWRCRRQRDGSIEFRRGGLAWYGKGLEVDVLWANWKTERDRK